MNSFGNVMALFWTLAEGAILLFVRWGLASLEGRRRGQRRVVAACLALFALLVLLVIVGEGFFRGPLALERARNLFFYQASLWNFFCTLWAVIEGIVVIYVVRIFRHLKAAGEGGAWGPARIPRIGVPLVVLVLFSVFGAYEILSLRVMESHSLDIPAIDNLARFQVKLWGFFWILFEWGVAVLGVRAFRVLRKGEKVRA